MSLSYQAVGWNRTKKIYDTVLVGGLALYLACSSGSALSCIRTPRRKRC